MGHNIKQYLIFSFLFIFFYLGVTDLEAAKAARVSNFFIQALPQHFKKKQKQKLNCLANSEQWTIFHRLLLGDAPPYSPSEIKLYFFKVNWEEDGELI